MAKYLARANAARLELVLQRLHKTSGGVSETEAKELMVRPTCRPLPSVVVTMATPVANAAKLLRNSRASNIGAIWIC